METCFMSIGRVVLRICAVLSAAVLMHVRQDSFDFYNSKCRNWYAFSAKSLPFFYNNKWFQLFVLRKLSSSTLHWLAMRTSALWTHLQVAVLSFDAIIHVSAKRLILCFPISPKSWCLSSDIQILTVKKRTPSYVEEVYTHIIKFILKLPL